MSKAFDTRTVEYAYVASVRVDPNRLTVPGNAGATVDQLGNPITPVPDVYKHLVSVQYELKDADRALLGHRTVTHEVNSTGHDSVETHTTATSAALPAFIAADKLALAGYGS